MKSHPPAITASAGHRYALRVYYEDSDAAGIVYHANYLRYAERARTEALRDLGAPHAAMVRTHRVMFLVRRVKLDYVRPARVDEVIVVVTRLLRAGGASVVLSQDFERETGEMLARAEIQLACVSTEDGRAARLPAAWRDALAHLAVAPAGVASPSKQGG